MSNTSHIDTKEVRKYSKATLLEKVKDIATKAIGEEEKEQRLDELFSEVEFVATHYTQLLKYANEMGYAISMEGAKIVHGLAYGEEYDEEWGISVDSLKESIDNNTAIDKVVLEENWPPVHSVIFIDESDKRLYEAPWDKEKLMGIAALYTGPSDYSRGRRLNDEL